MNLSGESDVQSSPADVSRWSLPVPFGSLLGQHCIGLSEYRIGHFENHRARMERHKYSLAQTVFWCDTIKSEPLEQ